jgi:hypothetical protein
MGEGSDRVNNCKDEARSKRLSLIIGGLLDA